MIYMGVIVIFLLSLWIFKNHLDAMLALQMIRIIIKNHTTLPVVIDESPKDSCQCPHPHSLHQDRCFPNFLPPSRCHICVSAPLGRSISKAMSFCVAITPGGFRECRWARRSNGFPAGWTVLSWGRVFCLRVRA